MNKVLPVVILVAVVAVAGAFYGGMQYAQSKVPQGFRQLGTASAADGFRGARSGATAGSFGSGQIIAKDDKSITIKMQNGGSKIVFYSGTTEISKFVSGAASDLGVGNNVTVNGSANQDGSITAQTIQIRPAIAPTATP